GKLLPGVNQDFDPGKLLPGMNQDFDPGKLLPGILIGILLHCWSPFRFNPGVKKMNKINTCYFLRIGKI
ncbi:hypothetical protein LDX94_18050, partial [Acinetobacter baumannii]